MLVKLLVIALIIFAILWFVSIEFKRSILNRIMLLRLKRRIKEKFTTVDLAEIGFRYFQDKSDLKEIKDVLLSEMDKLNDYYKEIVTRINPYMKTDKFCKFIYEAKFNECIEMVNELEIKCNNAISIYNSKN